MSLSISIKLSKISWGKFFRVGRFQGMFDELLWFIAAEVTVTSWSLRWMFFASLIAWIKIVSEMISSGLELRFAGCEFALCKRWLWSVKGVELRKRRFDRWFLFFIEGSFNIGR